MEQDDTDVGCDITIARRKLQQSNGNLSGEKTHSQNSLDSKDSEKNISSDPTTLEGSFTTLDLMCIVSGMFMYIADLVTDLVVGWKYFRQGHILWSSMTFVFVLLPTMVLQYFSLRWFVSDLNENQNYKSKGALGKIWSWFQWLATHILQLGAIKRYWHTLQYGLLSRKDSAYYQEMVFERVDITMLRLLESFMESAPQLVLQVYIMATIDEFYWLTAVSAVVSLSSLAFALGAYHKALRDSRPDKLNMSYYGMALRVLWRLFTIAARVIALALFASIYKWWVFVIVALHWAIMTAWLIWQKTEFHGTTCDEVPFDAVIGVVHIFCFFNMKEGCSRYRALAFYSVIFLENTIMFGLWYCQRESREKLYGLPALVFVWGGFFVGLLLMFLYYRFCHPTGRLPLCLGGEDSGDVDGDPSIGRSRRSVASVEGSVPLDKVSLSGADDMNGKLLPSDDAIDGSLSHETFIEDEIDEANEINAIDEVDGREETIDVRDKPQANNEGNDVGSGDTVYEVNILTHKCNYSENAINQLNELCEISDERGTTENGTVVTISNAASKMGTIDILDEPITAGDEAAHKNVVDDADNLNVVKEENVGDELNVVEEGNVRDKGNVADEENEHIMNETSRIVDLIRTNNNLGGRLDCFMLNHNGSQNNRPRFSRSKSLLERDRYQYIFSKKWRRQNSLL